jgi:hypothetical protein
MLNFKYSSVAKVTTIINRRHQNEPLKILGKPHLLMMMKSKLNLVKLHPMLTMAIFNTPHGFTAIIFPHHKHII